MRTVIKVMVQGRLYPVTVSDEKEALQAAYAAGGAVVGLWEQGGPQKDCTGASPGGKAGGPSGGKDMDISIPDLSPALYIAGSWPDIDEGLLKKAVCRRFHIPWEIAVTRRLLIREFRASDPLPPEEEEFKTPELLSSYIACQYRFHECGLWALVRRSDGQIVGKAGIADAAERELGYHIYTPYRRQGFAEEACRAILSWAKAEGFPDVSLRIKKDNAPSLSLAKKLGFLPETDSPCAKPETQKTNRSGADEPEQALYFRINLHAPGWQMRRCTQKSRRVHGASLN